jgi:hypothetical protein
VRRVIERKLENDVADVGPPQFDIQTLSVENQQSAKQNKIFGQFNPQTNKPNRTEQTNKQTIKQTKKQTNSKTINQSNTQTNKTNKQTNKQTDKQDKQTLEIIRHLFQALFEDGLRLLVVPLSDLLVDVLLPMLCLHIKVGK